MILADSSVWIDFLRGNERGRALVVLLEEQKVLCHSWILGELVLGNTIGKNREEFLKILASLPRIKPSTVEEITQFALSEKLSSLGIGLVDLQILHSCFIHKIPLITHDKNLKKLAHRYHVSFEF